MASKFDYENKINAFIRYFEEGRNIFLTGKAGTGKSYFIRNYFKNQSNSVLLSLFNTSARNIEGETIHKFFELNLRTNLPKSKYLDDDKIELIKNVKTFVIDEIFSVRADLIDSIDKILKEINSNSLPFGGKQMIFVGDVFQLRPIVKKNEGIKLSQTYSGPFFFNSNVYLENDWQIINLTYNFRHIDDVFDRILDNIRTNEISPEEIKLLNSKLIDENVVFDDAIEIVPTNETAHLYNEKYLESINSPINRYFAVKTSGFDIKSSPFEDELKLKIGAKVILTMNYLHILKGSIGIVKYMGTNYVSIDFKIDDRIEEIMIRSKTINDWKYSLNKETGEISYTIIDSCEQIPLQLGYSMTIHKAQSMEFDKIIVNTENIFQSGQLYAAISRVKSIDGLYLRNELQLEDLMFDESIIDFYLDYILD